MTLDHPQQALPLAGTMGAWIVMHTNHHPPTSVGPTCVRCELVLQRGNQGPSTPTQGMIMAVLLGLALMLTPQAIESHRKAVGSILVARTTCYYAAIMARGRCQRSASGVQKLVVSVLQAWQSPTQWLLWELAHP